MHILSRANTETGSRFDLRYSFHFVRKLLLFFFFVLELFFGFVLLDH